jgi:phytol kinase
MELTPEIQSTVAKGIALLVIMLFSGSLARYFSVRVNYTRKINHFAIFFLPVFIDKQFNTETFTDIEYLSITAAVTALSFLAFYEPIRNLIPPYQLMFEGFDRPEDRPHTLAWIWTQIIAGFAVMIPMIWLFGEWGLSSLVLIPILINIVGDGLAEPVGIRFGTHEYKTKALFTSKEYVRTLEGSACVLITGFIVVAMHFEYFTTTQFILSMLLVPIIMTLTEAYSPHTWDTPFLMFTGYMSLLLIMQF